MNSSKEKQSKLKYVKLKDVLACFVFLFMLPAALIAKIFIRNFWLVGEEKNEARDNGYWFFKYVRENHPERKIAYVINKKCTDFEKVKNMGKVIQWGSLSHWFWYLTAQKNISSQKGCKPNPAPRYLFEIKLRVRRNKRYFLQHGIAINDAKWLYNKNCRFELFVCGAKPEFEYVKEKFGYPENNVKLLGFCRFDGLHNFVAEKNVILVMPTWRSYLVRSHSGIQRSELINQFISTDYFKKWSEFLTSEKLNAMLSGSGCKIIFYPHRNMQIFLDKFKQLSLSENIEIANPEELSVQQAMKNAACLITDYSSVFFDFAYMGKPVIFYQFDEEAFRAYQYSQGYFDYHNNPLGKWSGNLDDCLCQLSNEINCGFEKSDSALEFFEFYDGDNCKRNYEAIAGKK